MINTNNIQDKSIYKTNDLNSFISRKSNKGSSLRAVRNKELDERIYIIKPKQTFFGKLIQKLKFNFHNTKHSSSKYNWVEVEE